MFGILVGMPPLVSERRMSELVGDHIVSERERAVLEGAVEHDQSAPVSSLWRLEEDFRGPAPAFGDVDPKGRVAHELLLDHFRQLREDTNNPRPQTLILNKHRDELFRASQLSFALLAGVMTNSRRR